MEIIKRSMRNASILLLVLVEHKKSELFTFRCPKTKARQSQVEQSHKTYKAPRTLTSHGIVSSWRVRRLPKRKKINSTATSNRSPLQSHLEVKIFRSNVHRNQPTTERSISSPFCVSETARKYIDKSHTHPSRCRGGKKKEGS